MGATLAPVALIGGWYYLFCSVHYCQKIGTVLKLYYSNYGNTLIILGPLVARAALYTAGVVGALSLTAACAPSEKYLYMSGPLSLGLGVVFVASIGMLVLSDYQCI